MSKFKQSKKKLKLKKRKLENRESYFQFWVFLCRLKKSKNLNNILSVNLVSLFSFYTKFWVVRLFNFLVIRISGLWKIDIFENSKKLKNSNSIINLFTKSVVDIGLYKFKLFNNFEKQYGLADGLLAKFTHYLKFLYKFDDYRELSFVCQSFFIKLKHLSLFFYNPKSTLVYSWDPAIIKYISLTIFFEKESQWKKIKGYISLHKKILENQNINVSWFTGRFISNITTFLGSFSFGPFNRSGKDHFINFILFLRKSYLTKYKFIKNLIWVHFTSKKKVSLNYFWDFLNNNSRFSFTNFNTMFFDISEFSKKLKFFISAYYKEGLNSQYSKIKFDYWSSELLNFLIWFNIIPFSKNNRFDRFLLSLIYFSFCYISNSYKFFKFLFSSFKDLEGRFNFGGLPILSSIKYMIQKLAPKKTTLKRIWSQPLSNLLFKKYKDLRIWKLWKDYRFLLKSSKELNLKNYIKSNQVFRDYYMKFFSLKPKSLKKSIKLNSLESRVDIILYRLGFMHDLYYLRKCINKGWFISSNYQIKNYSFYIPLNCLVFPTLRASINLLKQFNLFKLTLIRSKQFNRLWFVSKINYLRYLEVDFFQFSLIKIRSPRFGELTYMTGLNKFTKKRYPLFENIKSKHLIFSKNQYSWFLSLF